MENKISKSVWRSFSHINRNDVLLKKKGCRHWRTQSQSSFSSFSFRQCDSVPYTLHSPVKTIF
jgi:hypothetical protein